ncbi:uncharacterized protein At2g27730, mitochondrial [Syzygium oleosum]|uniref:uncharacterized protein At2g27730, mitochondrial n=1 Tax=Syzygium oleosum TaxID=219896 RepID=UPI0011D24AD7|nr:uncharacterized protein At2g27730, mitochondrial [Syzygium oleosum]
MAMRAAAARRASLIRFKDSSRGATRYMSSGQGRILSDEELAAEKVYIQKMERERMEKQRRKAEKEKAEKEKEGADKKPEEARTA